ncbi:hypothetical protein TNIN_90531, partial [Trichonephila inaurata madagascariensis]
FLIDLIYHISFRAMDYGGGYDMGGGYGGGMGGGYGGGMGGEEDMEVEWEEATVWHGSGGGYGGMKGGW